MRIYYEEVPEHYVGEYPAVTIKYRKQDKHEAKVIGELLWDSNTGEDE